MKNLICSGFVAVFLSGCTYYQPIGVSSTSVGSQYERPSGIAEGVARRWYFFPCYSACPIGEDSLKAAIDDALDGNVGDTLANVYAERRTIAFPHIYLPLIVRSDIIVTGTLVKYNTKEFPPDNAEYMYSKSSNEVWSGLKLLDRENQKKQIRLLSDKSRAQLVEHAYINESRFANNSDDALFFESLMGHKPRKHSDVTENNGLSDSKAVFGGESCSDYQCMIWLAPEQQASRIAVLNKSMAYSDQIAFSNLIAAANKKVRACRPDKEEPVLIDPEVQLIDAERKLLSYLCRRGYMKK